jgi:DNA (cytosine-5)-methyltransferase 1
MTDREFEPWFAKQLQQRCYRALTDAARTEYERRIRTGIRNSPFLHDCKILEGDVRKLTGTDLLRSARLARGELTLMAGGPPCQPFSRAGKRETVTNSDGRLFLDFARLVDEIRPRFFLFENVKGLAQSKTSFWRSMCDTCGRAAHPPFDDLQLMDDRLDPAPPCVCGSPATHWQHRRSVPGGSLELVVAEFERLGYVCEWRLLNAVDFGAPQFRERVIVLGSRDGESLAWPDPTHGEPPDDCAVIPLFEQASLKPWRSVGESLWSEGHPSYGRLNGDEAVLWVKNVVRPHDEPVTWGLSRPAPTVGAHQAAKLAIAPYGVPEEQLRRQQWHVLGRRQGDLPPVPVEHAYLSDEELLRLQTFPPTWFLFGTRMHRAFQIGNAVPPVLASAVGRALLGTAESRALSLAS